jgi:hypothetical protein
VELTFKNPLFYWRGPAPFYFIRVPKAKSDEIKLISHELTYGWGVIPLRAQIKGVEFTTALIPKDGHYLLPIKNAVRIPLKLQVDQQIQATIYLEA